MSQEKGEFKQTAVSSETSVRNTKLYFLYEEAADSSET